MIADESQHSKSPIRPSKQSDSNIGHSAGLVAGVPIWFAAEAFGKLRRFSHSAKKHVAAVALDKELRKKSSDVSIGDLIRKMAAVMERELGEMQISLEISQKEEKRAKKTIALLTNEVAAARDRVKTLQIRGEREIAKTAKRLFGDLGKTQTRATKAERELEGLKEQIALLQKQQYQAKSDVVKLCVVLCLFLVAWGALWAQGHIDVKGFIIGV